MCLFCKIRSSEILSHKVYEDRYTLAFLDLKPVVEGHTILIPKRHVETIFDLDDYLAQNLGRVLFVVAKKLKNVYGRNLAIYCKSGSEASQEQPHLHYHLIPRKKGDRLWGGVEGHKSLILLDTSSGFERLSPTKEELEAITKKINGV